MGLVWMRSRMPRRGKAGLVDRFFLDPQVHLTRGGGTIDEYDIIDLNDKRPEGDTTYEHDIDDRSDKFHNSKARRTDPQ